MKKNIKAIYLIEIALLFLTILFYMLTKVVSSNIKSYLAITFLLMIFIPSLFIFGFQITKKYYSDYCNRLIITVLLAAGIIIYALGIILGFTHGYKLTISRFINSVGPMIIIIFLEEVLREILTNHSHSTKTPMIIISIIIALIQIILNINYGTINTNYDKFVLISVTIIPAVVESFLCTYLVYKSNFITSTMYRLITGLYMYILPIVPNLGYYIYASIKVIIPFIIFHLISKSIMQEESKKIVYKITKKIYAVPIIIVLIILVALTSGIYKYKLIAVATNSMNKVFYRGDAILLEYTKPDEILVGDILVFNHEGRIITHRVIDIQKGNNKIVFNTKGDANPTPDGFVTNEKDVIGKVNYVIKYIGFPTVWAKEYFGKG